MGRDKCRRIDNLYARQAFKEKKWAFVSDYFRLKIIYEQGGIYLDTDVELIKSLDSLAERYDGFFGYEKGENLIATGLGFGAKKGDKFVKAMLDEYDGISFLGENGEFDTTPCPKRNTKAILSLGLDTALRNQVIDNVCFLNEDVLCPINFFTRQKAGYKGHGFNTSLWCFLVLGGYEKDFAAPNESSETKHTVLFTENFFTDLIGGNGNEIFRGGKGR